MTTLIDDGLVEGCLDELGVVNDSDTVIDIETIDATIEDPGYILDEDPDTLNSNEVYKSTDKRRSFALPVTFFDINNNITLLQKCRPISIKIVDCNVYPWYYRKKKHTVKTSGTVYNKDENLDQCKLRYDSSDLIDLTCCDTLDLVISTPSVNEPKINLSPEQRSFVIKLKEDIDNQTYLNEVYNNNNNDSIETIVINDINKEIAPSKNHQDLIKVNRTSIDENASELNDTIDINDLITYKEIAQTIVRNIEQNTVSNKSDNLYVQNQNTNSNKHIESNILINVEDSVRNIPEQNKEERTEILTSPILPYTIKRQKKTKSTEKILPTPTKGNGIMERCINFNKNCDKSISSVNQIIPHYHSKQSVEANNDNNFTSMIANEMHFQEPISKSSSLHCHQQLNKKDIVSGNNRSITSYNSGGRLLTKSYNIADVSYLDSCEELRNNPAYTTIHNGNSLRCIRRSVKQLGNENCGILSQTSIPTNNLCDNDIPYASCLQNNYVNCSMRIPMQCQISNVSSAIQRNPILSQILNTNDVRKYYQPKQKVYSGLDPKPVMASTPYPPMGPNIRLPSRPPLFDYEPNCPPTQYTQHENFQWSNAGTLVQDFQNMENINLFQGKSKSSIKNFGNIANNPRNYNNLKCIPIDPPKVTVSMSTRVDPVKQNVYPQTQIQNISKTSSELCGNIKPKSINTNAKINQQNMLKVSVKPNITKDVINNNKKNIDTMINVLSNKKSDCLSSKVHKMYAQEKIKQQQGMPELNQLDTKSKGAGVSKTSYTIVHLAKLKDISTPEKAEFKVNGYSPPILPIPSFKKSLEMLSGIHHSRKLTGNNYVEADANKMLDMSKDSRKKPDFTNITRKRKLFIEEKVFGNTKRISLQEYKQRRSENMNNIKASL